MKSIDVCFMLHIKEITIRLRRWSEPRLKVLAGDRNLSGSTYHVLGCQYIPCLGRDSSDFKLCGAPLHLLDGTVCSKVPAQAVGACGGEEAKGPGAVRTVCACANVVGLPCHVWGAPCLSQHVRKTSHFALPPGTQWGTSGGRRPPRAG